MALLAALQDEESELDEADEFSDERPSVPGSPNIAHFQAVPDTANSPDISNEPVLTLEEPVVQSESISRMAFTVFDEEFDNDSEEGSSVGEGDIIIDWDQVEDWEEESIARAQDDQLADSEVAKQLRSEEWFRNHSECISILL